jgi:hypothetical protein
VLHELATPRRRSAPPLIGFVCLSESCRATAMSRPLVCVNPLCRYPHTVPKHRTGPALRPHAAALPRNSQATGRSSHRLWLPYRVSPMHHRDRDLLLAQQTRVRPFRGLVPLSVLPIERSHLPPAVSNPPVTLRPQGFSPSRRFAPRAICWACFIPVPLLGFSLRGLIPCLPPYVLSDAAPLLRFARPVWVSALFRVLHVSQSPDHGPGV